MPETRCRFAVNLTTFTLPLVLDFILICIYYWAYNSCVKIKDVQVPLQIGGFLLSVMGGFSLLTFCKRKSIECGACSFCSYIVFAVIFFVVVFFSLNYGFNTGLSGSSFDRAEPYGSHPRLDHFPQAFRDKVSGAEEWDHIIACLAPSIGCDRLNRTYTSPQQLSSAHLNPLQSQCCMPPSQCGLSFVSPTYWEFSTTNQTYVDADCTTWNNDQTKLCYRCDSCKERVLAEIKNKWRIAFILLLTTYLILIPISIYNCKCSKILED